MSNATTMTRTQKAAAILVAMGKPAASRMLKFFKQEELKALIEGARLLRTIPQNELEKIVAEFEAEFTEGAGLMDSAESMDMLLSESLSPEEVNAIMYPGGGGAEFAAPMPVWPQVEGIEPARIGAFLSAEHPQTGAYVLSKLGSATAAATLLTLDKRLRGELVKRMVSLASVPEAAERIIERQIRERLLSESASRDMSVGQLRVAGLLNEMDKDALEEVMRDLEEAGATDLEAIRARLFSFEDIPLLTQKARVALFDGLSTELVTLALRNCSGALGEAVLSAIGARSRRMIESELAQGVDVPAADIVRARKVIASTAIRMAGEGAFELPSAQQAQAA